MTFQKVLIAVDGSEYSLNAVKKGLALTDQLEATVAMVYVIDTAKAMGNIEAGITHEAAMLLLIKAAEQAFDNIAALFNKREFIRFMPEGHPKDDIIKTAEFWGADLLVIGTHGRTGLAHLLTGSTAEYIIRHSKVPVVVVPFR
jgi:nucleotide-binding universal stress UspA family protein